jgi:inhibitor of cysteine peptidase
MIRGLFLAVALAVAASPTVTVGARMNGKAVTVPRGGRLVVRLASNPSTGYSWRIVARPTGVRLLSRSYVPPQSGRVGAGGVAVFTFRVSAPGVLRLFYAQPWRRRVGTAFTLRLRVG